MTRPFRILSLDGGGAKGCYTLGVLREVEAAIGGPLVEKFDLIYGTSTGAIIASLLGLGYGVEDIVDLYIKLIPSIMAPHRRSSRTRALHRHAREIFEDKCFQDFKTSVGIVALSEETRRPMVFKSAREQAHGLRASFVPGFGATIADAVLASCAAFPFFAKHQVRTANQGIPVLLDGGFAANNPTLFAITDAIGAIGRPRDQVRVLSIGVGHYPEPKRGRVSAWLRSLWPFALLSTTFEANSNTVETIRQLVFQDVEVVRIDDTYSQASYATDLLESRQGHLSRLLALGRESYSTREPAISSLFRHET